MRFQAGKSRKMLSGRAPQTQLGKLTVLHRPPSWICEKGRKREGKGKERGYVRKRRGRERGGDEGTVRK